MAFAAQLAAGGVDIAAQLAADRNGNAVALQPLLKSGHPAAGLQRALLHIIERDQVHMAGRPLQHAGPADQPASHESLTPSIMAYS